VKQRSISLKWTERLKKESAKIPKKVSEHVTECRTAIGNKGTKKVKICGRSTGNGLLETDWAWKAGRKAGKEKQPQ
jgi:hypothetical protein